MLNIGLEQQQQIRGADGTILWSGAQVIANEGVFINSGATAIKMADLVQFDSTNSVIPRPETTAAGATPTADLPMSLSLQIVISPATVNAINPVGVAQDPGGTNKRILVAGVGSLVCVASTATLLAVGALVSQSAATAGAVALATVSALNSIVGGVFKINTVAAPGTGSTGFAGIHLTFGGGRYA